MRKGDRYYRGGVEIDVEDALDDGVVRDGVALHVPLHMRDGLPDGSDTPLVTDAAALRQPGYTILADAAERERARAIKEQALREAQFIGENAWRGNTGARAAAASAHNAAPLTMDEVAMMTKEQRWALKEKALRDAAEADENAWRSGNE